VEIPAELNLIGSRREEAISAAERYLDVAFLAGLKEVRIIHGKGTGILRKGIEEMLSTHAMVEDFHLAPIQQGGAGATIVRIKS
jgi:DNA mismatch repair protein MutS2